MEQQIRHAAAALLSFALCVVAPATALAQGVAPPPARGQRPPPPPPGMAPAPTGDWKPGDPRPPPPGAFPPPPPVAQAQANAPVSPPAGAGVPGTAITSPTATTPVAAPPVIAASAPAAPLPADAPPAAGAAPPSAFPPWPAQADATAAGRSTPTAAPVRDAPPVIVERVVTRDVVRWPWWATAALALLVLAWWRSHRRARALADSSDVLARRQRHMAATQRHLRERADQLQKTAVHDALTGTLTRQAFAGALDAAIAHARHFGQPVALVMFDLDHFKQVNDTLGHAAGDAALKLVAGIVREKLTSNDLFGRFGGDEFLVGLIGNDGHDALRVADAIRASLARHVQDGRAPTRQLGLSLGVAIADPDWGYDVDALFERADAALYAAKRGGRNRAVLADRAVAAQDAPDRAAAHAPRTLAR